MLDDLRNNIDNDYGNEDDDISSDIPIDFDEIEAQQAQATKQPEPKFLGMTAGERAFLSMMIFFIVLIFGAAVLAVTGRITL